MAICKSKRNRSHFPCKILTSTPKRRKLDRPEVDLMQAPQFSFPSFQDPEYTTSKIAKTITLDLNDSQLLMDHVQTSVSRNAFGRSDLKKAGRGALAKSLSQRYNISNDEAYEQLKENHQSKVRSMLGNIPVEHSLPAVRLQWPLVSVKSTLSSQWNLLRKLTFQSTKPSWINRKLDRSTDQH